MRAYAKINLFLRVGKRRHDGYHSLVTLFQSIDLSDEMSIRITKTPGIRLRITGGADSIPSSRGNTVYKAYRWLSGRRFAKQALCGAGFDVRIKKNIPAGAGLGGASADAAGFLSGACRLLKLKIPAGSFSSIARSIGADVPFCLLGGTAIGKGLGERLTHIHSLPRRTVWIIVPNFNISTKWAYDRLSRTTRESSFRGSNAQINRLVNCLIKGIRPGEFVNDFQPVIFRRYPLLAKTAETLNQHGWCGLTGTGSALIFIPQNPVIKPRVEMPVQLIKSRLRPGRRV